MLEKLHVAALGLRVCNSLILLDGLRVMCLTLMPKVSSADRAYGVFFAGVVGDGDALAPDTLTLSYRVYLRQDVLRLGVINGRVVHPEGLVLCLHARTRPILHTLKLGGRLSEFSLFKCFRTLNHSLWSAFISWVEHLKITILDFKAQ